MRAFAVIYRISGRSARRAQIPGHSREIGVWRIWLTVRHSMRRCISVSATLAHGAAKIPFIVDDTLRHAIRPSRRKLPLDHRDMKLRRSPLSARSSRRQRSRSDRHHDLAENVVIARIMESNACRRQSVQSAFTLRARPEATDRQWMPASERRGHSAVTRRSAEVGTLNPANEGDVPTTSKTVPRSILGPSRDVEICSQNSLSRCRDSRRRGRCPSRRRATAARPGGLRRSGSGP